MDARAIELSGHTGSIRSIIVNSKTNLIATGSYRSQSPDRQIRLWDFSTGKLLHEIETGFNGIFRLACSSDGQYLAAGGGGVVIGNKWEYTNGIEIWDRYRVRQQVRIGADMFFVKSLAFSPDGELLLSASAPQPGSRPRPKTACVRLWRTSDFKQVAAFANGEDAVDWACFTASGEFVVFAHCMRASADITIESSAAEFRSQSLSTLGSLFSAAKKQAERVQSGSVTADPFIRVWNVRKKREDAPFAKYRGMVTGICLSPDGRYLVSSGAGLIVWDFASRVKIAEFDDGDESFFAHCVAFSPSGKILAVGTGTQIEFGRSL
jgi:WD40 repeat protein